MLKPSAPRKTYDLKKNILVIGGYDISGYGEDGGISYEMGADDYEVTKGADGGIVVSANNDDSMIATVKVMETSKAYKTLADLQRTQRASEGALPPLAYLHRDPINGDKVSDGQAVFLNRPAPSKGKKVGEREFKILLPSAAADMVLGALNTL